MAAPAVEKVIADIDRLSAEQQREVWQRLAEKLNGQALHAPATNGQEPVARVQAGESPAKADARSAYINRDRSQEYEWLRQHSAQYYDQWVALEGDRLLAHDPNYGKVYAAARAQGFEDALFTLVEEDRAQSTRLKGSRVTGVNVPMKDRARERDWLAQHRDEYGGEWVALDGDRLVAHSKKLKEVTEAVKQKGETDVFYARVVPRDELPWAGF